MWTPGNPADTRLLAKKLFILPKRQNRIQCRFKENVPSIQSMITFYIKMALPASEEIQPFVPTFKEIQQEVRKLPSDIIKQKRKDYNQFLQSACTFLICETLEQEIANKLINQNQMAAVTTTTAKQQQQEQDPTKTMENDTKLDANLDDTSISNTSM